MSDQPDATRGFYEEMPPADAGEHAITATATTTAAANLDLGISAGAQFVTFQPIGGDVFVRFKSTNSAAGTTTANGFKIPDGTTKRFWVTNASSIVDHICSAATKSLMWWKSSPNYRSRT